MISGLTAYLLGQGILREVDHKAFYDDLLNQEEYEQQFEQGLISHPHYRDDPSFKEIRQKHSQVHPQS